MYRLLIAPLFAICLASCGGGGSSNTAGGSPSPTPTTTPSPTPSPSSGGLATGEIKPSSGATYISATMEMTSTGQLSNNLNGEVNNASTSERETLLDTPSFTASYSPNTGYELADELISGNFGPDQLVGESSSEVLFSIIEATRERYLALYKHSVTTSSPSGTGTFEPEYAGSAGWQNTVLGSGSLRTRLNYFAYGPATPANDMPRSGVVKFSLLGSGNYASDTDLYFITNNDIVTVDFENGTVTGSVAGIGQNLFSGGGGGVYSFTFTGDIDGNTVTGPTASTIAVASGDFRMIFVGPQAEEFIFTFVGQTGRGTYVGSAVGVRNPFAP